MFREEINKKIISQIKKGLKKKLKLKDFKDLDFSLQLTPDSELGDFAWPCFQLAKTVKKSPKEIAEILSEETNSDKVIEKIEALNGYLNFFLKKPLFLKNTLKEVLAEKDNFGKIKIGKRKKILVEFSSPNTNKPQHLGHLRNNVLGAGLSNLLIWQGYKIIRTNLINDRGIHICKSMLAYQKFGRGETPKSSGLKGDYLVGKYYVLFEQKSKENSKLLEETRELLKKWESGDKKTIKLWQKLNNWVYQGFKEKITILSNKSSPKGEDF